MVDKKVKTHCNNCAGEGTVNVQDWMDGFTFVCRFCEEQGVLRIDGDNIEVEGEIDIISQ